LIPVALDAMGGDRAPEVTVAGAARAAKDLGIAVHLVGDPARIEPHLKRHSPLPDGLDIIPAAAVIGMDESPAAALLAKRDASIVVAMDLVKQGRACGVVSAGNSGAVMGAAALRLGLLPGVDRPAIAMLLPSRSGGVVVLDAGATVDSQPQHLLSFAQMGAAYAGCLLHRERPRVGLLNIGEEPSKGNAVAKKAYTLLADSSLNFVGNLEGEKIAEGAADVLVCDGFVGNVILKTVEGYAELFWGMLEQQLSAGVLRRLAAWLMRPGLSSLARKLDYAAYGGALLAGVNGVCVIGHGRSTPAAVENAIRVAKELADQSVVEKLRAFFGHDAGPATPQPAGRHLASHSEGQN
jgi:glycerol-3-phosphate acyltransferase PlsX